MRVLIIGLGSIGKKHVKVLRELYPGIEIFAFRSQPNSSVENDIVNIYSYSEIPQDILFFLISNPSFLHKGTIHKLLAFGKPLFIEKPILTEIDTETYSLREEINNRKILTYTACLMRFHPCIKFLKNYIDINNPRINEVSIYCGSFLPEWRPGKNYKEIYSAQKELGGGVHLDLIHEIDYLFYLFGKPQKINSELSSQSSLEIDAFDYAHYCLRYQGFSANITLNYYRPFPKRTIEIVFKDMVWEIDLLASTIINANGNLIFTKVSDQHSLLKTQMQAFIENLEVPGQLFNSFEESIEVLKICLNRPA